MLLLYTVACRLPGSALHGKYAPGLRPEPEPEAAGVGAASPFWQELAAAFAVLEADFRHFDADGSGFIAFAELPAGLPSPRPGSATPPPPPSVSPILPALPSAQPQPVCTRRPSSSPHTQEPSHPSHRSLPSRTTEPSQSSESHD